MAVFEELDDVTFARYRVRSSGTGTMSMTRDFDSPEEEQRLDRLRELIAEELPELGSRDSGCDMLRKNRRSVVNFSRQRLSWMEIVRRSEIEPLLLDSFLTCDATLSSDAMDRLAATLGCVLSEAPSTKAS